MQLLPETVLLLFLPVILFGESHTTSLRSIRRYFRYVLPMSTLLVVASAFAVAGIAVLFGMPWKIALILGAAVAPPDATDVAALAYLLLSRTASTIVINVALLLIPFSAFLLAEIITLAVWATLLVVRYLFQLMNTPFQRRPDIPLPRGMRSRARVVSTVAGMRGAVSLAIALSVPATIGEGGAVSGRYEIVFVTAGVILLSLLVQAPLLPAIVRWASFRPTTPRTRSTSSRSARFPALRSPLIRHEEHTRLKLALIDRKREVLLGLQGAARSRTGAPAGDRRVRLSTDRPGWPLRQGEGLS